MPTGKYRIHKFTPECAGAKIYDPPQYAAGCGCTHCIGRGTAASRLGQQVASEIRAEQEGYVDHVKVDRACEGHTDALFLTTMEKRMAVYKLHKQGLGAIRIGRRLGFTDRTVWRHLKALKDQGIL